VRCLRIFAGYLLLFAVLAAPWLLVAGSAIPISSPFGRDDTRLLTWILWWVADALAHHPGTLVDAPINYPAPAQLTGSEHFGGLQLVFLPIWLLTQNPVLALNTILFLSYPLAALAMNRLLVALGISNAVAWVGGLLFALGALQVPTHVHLLHTLAFFLPAIVLAMHRLRERPDRWRGALFAAALVGAFFSAYYTTAILMPLLLICGLGELRRPLPDARRFAAIAGLAVVGALVLLAIASRPYLARGALVSAGDGAAQVRGLSGLFLVYVVLEARTLFGVTALLLGAAGCIALFDRRLRPIAAGGLLLFLVSAALVIGGAFALHKLPPTPIGSLIQAPFAFFRIAARWAVVAGFGLALLAAAALEWWRRRVPWYLGHAMLASVAVLVLIERGTVLYGQVLDVPRALTSDAPTYGELAHVFRRYGDGPLLEVPISSFGHSTQPDAMLGAMTHGQPLIVGHTGYQPPHRALIDATIKQLPSEDAVQELVDMTHLRWVVVRSDEDWGGHEKREAFLDALEQVPGVTRVADVGTWSVLEISRAPLHDERFAAIAHGAGIDDVRDAGVAHAAGTAGGAPVVAADAQRAALDESTARFGVPVALPLVRH
jgi:hypothetical protein